MCDCILIIIIRKICVIQETTKGILFTVMYKLYPLVKNNLCVTLNIHDSVKLNTELHVVSQLPRYQKLFPEMLSTDTAR